MKTQKASKSIRFLVVSGLIAGLYTALTVVLAPISFGIVQCRVSEALTILAAYSPSSIVGLTVGCFLSNLISMGSNPAGAWDLLLGPLATGLAAVLSYWLRGVRFRGLPVLFGLVEQNLNEVQNHGLDLADFPAQVQPQIHGHLIIPAAAGVQALAGIADALGQKGFNIHMDILRIHGKFHLAAFDVSQQVLQALMDGGHIVFGNDAGIAQHLGMGQRALNIFLIHPLVKPDGRVKIIDKCIGFFLEPSCPKFHDQSPQGKMFFYYKWNKGN